MRDREVLGQTQTEDVEHLFFSLIFHQTTNGEQMHDLLITNYDKQHVCRMVAVKYYFVKRFI